MLKHPLPQEVVDAFHTMWDMFPEPVSLVHKSREVIAVSPLPDFAREFYAFDPDCVQG